jgi:hypothetical protein
MSVVNINQIDTEYSDTDEGYRSYLVTLEVICSDPLDTARTVVNAVVAAWPPYTQFPSDTWCRARRPRSCKRRATEKSRKVWRVQLEFTNRPLKFDQATERGDPVSQAPKISGSFVRAMKAAMVDRNGDPLTNSVDEPYIPAPEIDDSRDSLIVEVNTATINLATRSGMRDKVNNASYWGLGKRTIKLGQWAYTVEYYAANTYYIAHRFEFEINLDKWDDVRLDMGHRFIADIVDGEIVYESIMDGKDQRLREARLLDGAGSLLAGDPPVPFELRREIYAEADFTSLPLPNPLF